MRAQFAIGLAVTVALTGACGGGSDEETDSAGGSASGSSEPPPVVDCETRIQLVPSQRPPTAAAMRRSIVAGPVVFVDARARENDEPGKGSAINAKVSLLVDAAAPVTLSLSEGSSGNATITVGLDGPPGDLRGPAVELRPCPPDAVVAGRPVGEQTPFAAGLRLERPACVHLRLQVEGDPQPIPAALPIGAPCQSS